MQLPFFQSVLSACTGSASKVKHVESVSGGCINQAVKLCTTTGDFFLKWNPLPGSSDLFEKEKLGLGILDKSPLSTPMVIGSGSENDVAYLLLEWIEPYERSKTYWENFGQYLALQHRITSSHYGLDHPNHIGRLSQINDRTEDWVQFFIDCRLAPQLQLAYQNQLIDTQFLSKFRRLYPQLPHLIFADTPSLLHGDLWSGNCMAGGGGKPYIFDPAVYFGHREMELAFTLLFGGFDPLFYQSYAAEWPLENGFDERAEIYHLYPLLVHANLFGASYLSGIYQILKKYI